jgi:hypothetical protein
MRACYILDGTHRRRTPRMIRLALALVCLHLPVAALAQTGGAAAMPAPAGAAMASEPLSRAQVVQMIADRGYFEMDDLRRGRDGSWRCTALAGPGRRVAITMDKRGNITQTDLPGDGQQ